MKQIIKLAELNMSYVAASKELSAALEAKNFDRIDSAKYSLKSADEAMGKQSGSKRFENECAKYTIDQINSALIAAGYDTTVGYSGGCKARSGYFS